MSRIQVNSEKIMKEIQMNLEDRGQGQYLAMLNIPRSIAETDIFNREEDVAATMRKICARYETPKKSTVVSEISALGNMEQGALLKEAMYEIERINEYVFHNNMHASNNLLVGMTIEPENPTTLRDKVVIFLKRIVRKATRFLTRDQAKVNEYFVNAITGLRESQLQSLKLAQSIEQMYLMHEQEKQELQKRINELNDEIVKLKTANNKAGLGSKIGENK